MTVQPGGVSRHSIGSPAAPAAYDVVVNGMSPWEAAERLRRAGAPFQRYMPKGAHGTQGPHLHVEPYASGVRVASRAGASTLAWKVEDPTPEEQALGLLQNLARQDTAEAQLQLGRTYAEAPKAQRDLVAAYVWTALARSNPAASPDTESEAEAALLVLARSMTSSELAQAQRFSRQALARCGPAERPAGAPILLVSSGPQSASSCRPGGSPPEPPLSLASSAAELATGKVAQDPTREGQF